MGELFPTVPDAAESVAVVYVYQYRTIAASIGHNPNHGGLNCIKSKHIKRSPNSE